MTESEVLVVDANIWLDYFFGYRPGNAAAQDLLNQALRLEMSLVIPSHCLSTVFFLSQRILKALNEKDGKLDSLHAAASARVAAWAAIDFIMGIAAVGPSDHSDALVASKHRGLHGDYEDNLVIACAMRTKARLLVTNDGQLIKHSPVPTMNSKDAARFLSLE